MAAIIVVACRILPDMDDDAIEKAGLEFKARARDVLSFVSTEFGFDPPVDAGTAGQ
jgi:hypothetical protein